MAPNIIKDAGNSMDKVLLRTAEGHTAEIYVHGASLTSWKSPDGEDLLFLSSKAIFAPPKAIRGGVPVCFPQFGQLGPLGQHGFARNSIFTVVDGSDDSVTMELQSSGVDNYPYPFKLTLTTTLCTQSLTQKLTATNTGSEPMPFTAALHTYFAISDVAHFHIAGLQGVTYLDSLRNKERTEEVSERLRVDQEVDRIYLDAPDMDVKIVDETSGRVMEVKKSGFPDFVVWNPWVDKSQAMADFGDEEYKNMVCIEAAVAGSGPFTIQPGSSWEGTSLLSYYSST